MTGLLLFLLAWAVFAVALGVLVGKVIKRGDEADQPGRPWVAGEGYVTDEELWEAQLRHPSGRKWDR